LKVDCNGAKRDIRALWFSGRKLMMIDQRCLPHRVRVEEYRDHTEVATAIRDMVVRGAPSIGAAAAYGMCLAAMNDSDLLMAAKVLKAARPTANDLFFAVDHMLTRLSDGEDPVKAANAYADTIVNRCRTIGENGAPLITEGGRVMTHCNAGALATVDIGTALAPMRVAWEQGRKFFVYVSETRPRLQGMRLTAWELQNEGIPYAIIADSASGFYMRKGVDLIIVGADRITANGDFANKIGTYEKAVIAKALDIPFYVAAPISTFDLSLPTGDEIPIENRGEEEVIVIEGHAIAPAGATAFNPAFDVTPHEYVTGFITEAGILRPDEVRKIGGSDGE